MQTTRVQREPRTARCVCAHWEDVIRLRTKRTALLHESATVLTAARTPDECYALGCLKQLGGEIPGGLSAQGLWSREWRQPR